MKKKFLVIILILTVMISFANCDTALAKKKKKGGLAPAVVTEMNTNINLLMKKVYAYSLFSPEDTSMLIELKMKLDDAYETSPEATELAKLFFNVGFLSKKREFKQNSVDCFKIVLEGFPDSAYASKASSELKKMGIEIKIEEDEEEE